MLLLSSQGSVAQSKKLIVQPAKPTVLVDDTRAESLRSAKEVLDQQRISAIKALSGLSTRQLQNINRLAEQREKKLKQIDEQLTSMKERLAALQSTANKNNAKQIQKTTDEISKLAIERQKVAAEAMKKIKSQLTNKQLAALNAAN